MYSCTAERKEIGVACGFDICIDLLLYKLAVVVSTLLRSCMHMMDYDCTSNAIYI